MWVKSFVWYSNCIFLLYTFQCTGNLFFRDVLSKGVSTNLNKNADGLWRISWRVVMTLVVYWYSLWIKAWLIRGQTHVWQSNYISSSHFHSNSLLLMLLCLCDLFWRGHYSQIADLYYVQPWTSCYLCFWFFSFFTITCLNENVFALFVKPL